MLARFSLSRDCVRPRNSFVATLPTVHGWESARPGLAQVRAQMIIVGGGRVGQAIADMGDGSDVIIRRGEEVVGPAGPILVCTRNDALESVVENTPPDRRKDLVFIQNGMIQPWLKSKGLEGNTQALIYFAVASAGAKPIDGITDANPEGLTAVWGPHAEALAARLQQGGLTCHVLDKDAFQRSMLEKLIWICAFMAVGDFYKCTVGEVEAQHREEVSDLILELAAAGAPELGVTLDDGCVERLCAYARSVAHFPTAIKEFEWRNGWFCDLSKRSAAADPCPLHSKLLASVAKA